MAAVVFSLVEMVVVIQPITRIMHLMPAVTWAGTLVVIVVAAEIAVVVETVAAVATNL